MTNKAVLNHQLPDAAKATVEHILTLDCAESRGIVHAVRSVGPVGADWRTVLVKPKTGPGDVENVALEAAVWVR